VIVDAPSAPGNRGLWLKVKCLTREEFVVVGWTDPEGSRPWLGALLLAYYDPDGRLTSGPSGGWSTSLVSCGLIQSGSTVASARPRLASGRPTSSGRNQSLVPL
jgi:ATP-dependent DNA ligase